MELVVEGGRLLEVALEDRWMEVAVEDRWLDAGCGLMVVVEPLEEIIRFHNITHPTSP